MRIERIARDPRPLVIKYDILEPILLAPNVDANGEPVPGYHESEDGAPSGRYRKIGEAVLDQFSAIRAYVTADWRSSESDVLSFLKAATGDERWVKRRGKNPQGDPNPAVMCERIDGKKIERKLWFFEVPE